MAELKPISLLCSTCGENPHIVTLDKKEFAYVAHEQMVQWSDKQIVRWVLDEKQKHPDLKDNNWERSNRVPCKGEERIVFVGFPFHYCIGESFYSMFYPASVYWNGWGSAEEIESTAIVKCKFISVLTKNETSAWIKIKVEEVIMLSELLEQIPPVESDTYFVTV